MAAEKVERRLTAMLAADIVGYSRLIEVDEEGTLAAMAKLRGTVVDSIIAERNGRVEN